MKFEILANRAFLPCFLFATVIAGYATVDNGAATKFATSVTTVKTQADSALAAAASLTRAEGITYAVQNLLFQADAPQLQTDVKAARDASGQLQTAITSISSVSAIVQSVSKYLGLVDEAIDLAKTLAA
jgi:hypothetical protein